MHEKTEFKNKYINKIKKNAQIRGKRFKVGGKKKQSFGCFVRLSSFFPNSEISAKQHEWKTLLSLLGKVFIVGELQGRSL